MCIRDRSCYKQEENGSFVLFFAEEREGLFGKEWVVQKEESDPLMEEGNMSLVPKSSVFDDQLRPCLLYTSRCV